MDLRDIKDRFLLSIQRKYGLIIAAIVALIILYLPQPQPVEFAGESIVLSLAGKRMLALLATLVVIFITEALPIGATVGIVYAWIVFFGILPEKEASRLFSHDAAWFLVGALMIAQVLVKYGIHKRILLSIMKIVGSKVKYISLGIIAFCSISAAFIAEHTIAALMLPVGLAFININGGYKNAPNLSRLFLFSIAFGCAIGGLGTPSGGGRNVVMIGFLEEIYNVKIGYGAWMVMALPIVFILIFCVWFLLNKTFKPEAVDLKDTSKKIREEMIMSPIQAKEWGVVGVFLLILFLYITKSNLGIGMISLFGAVLFLVFGLANWKDYQKINWGIPLLYFGAIGLGSCLQITGAATWLAAKSLGLIAVIIPLNGKMVVTAIGTVMMSAMSQVMSDGPCVATIGPVLLESARLSGIDPVFFGIACAISSAFAFMLIIGTPANAIIYSSGYLKPKDFFKAGFLIYITALIVLLTVAYFWWGFLDVGVNGFH
ncbi:MAG: DASS family sodium-coupled anion symporter [Candidatus Omnitrophota bacterium]